MEYISREAAIVRASKAIKDDGTAHDVKEALKDIPAEDVRPVRRGMWEKRHVHRGGFRRHTGIDDRGAV